MNSPKEPEDRPEVPADCLVIECRDGYQVEFEAEASRVDNGYEVWLSLFDEGELCSSCSAIVPSLDQWTVQALAIGYTEGWEQR